MDKEEQTPDFNIASKASERLSKAQRLDSDNMVLPDDYTALESNLDDTEVNQSGNALILTPNAIKIERIPFSTHERVRGHIK